MLLDVGMVVEGKVSGITNFGAFVLLPGGKTGLVHISEIAEEYVKNIGEYLKENQKVKVKVLSVNEKGKISLSIKKACEESQPRSGKTYRPAEVEWDSRQSMDRLSFEERLARFMKESDEKMLDLKKNFEAKRGAGSYKRSGVF